VEWIWRQLTYGKLIKLRKPVNGVTYGQMQEGSVLLGMTEFTIKPGRDTKFMEGVKAWKECYLENKGTWSWDVWSRLQEEDNVYVLSFFSEDWAVFDERDQAKQDCRGISRDQINPHVESSKYLIASSMPANSNSKPMNANTRAISVTYWNVNNPTEFMEGVNEFQSTMKEREGDIRVNWFSSIGIGPLEQRASFGIVDIYWFSHIGNDPDNFHYMTVMPLKDSARMDETGAKAWGLSESGYGKQSSNQAENIFNESVSKAWSYTYTRVEDLSRANGDKTASE
jgi:hypothetical protein